ncbi:MAG: hypothetical protein ABR954_08475 [Dehalococcoidales bacterium]
MDDMSTFWQILFSKLNPLQLFTSIPVVVAMIIAINAVWHALSDGERITVIICGCVFVICVIILIWASLRKPLKAIPILLKKMHERVMILSSSLSVDNLSQDDINAFLSLTSVDINKLQAFQSTVKDMDSLKEVAPDMIKLGADAAERDKSDAYAVWRTHRFIFEKIGLKQALKNDKRYDKLEKQLNRINIPTSEIQQSIFDFIYTSQIIGTWTPILSFQDSKTPIKNIVPKIFDLDAEIKIEETNNRRKLLLPKVIEAIDKYYKGDKK